MMPIGLGQSGVMTRLRGPPARSPPPLCSMPDLPFAQKPAKLAAVDLELAWAGQSHLGLCRLSKVGHEHFAFPQAAVDLAEVAEQHGAHEPRRAARFSRFLN